MHPVPLRHSTNITLSQNIPLLLPQFIITRSNISCLFVFAANIDNVTCPDPNIFVPTLTPFFMHPCFPLKFIFQNFKQMRQLFVVLYYTHMQCIDKIIQKFYRYDLYEMCDGIVNFTEFNMHYILNIC